MTFKGYEYLNKAMKGDLEPRTIIKTEHEKQYFDDRDYDYYIYHNDGMFHRCDKSGKLGAKYQDRFLNYKVLNKNFEMYCVLADEENEELRKLDYIEENTLCNKFLGKVSCMSTEEMRLIDSNFKELGNKINEIIYRVKKLERNKTSILL